MKEEMKEKYMEYQVLAQQSQEIQKQLQTLEEQEAEVDNIISGLDKFKEIKGEREILFPVSSGIFAKAIVKDSNELLVNVGSDVVVSKNVEETKGLLQENKEDISNMKGQLKNRIEKITQRTAEIEKQLVENV